MPKQPTRLDDFARNLHRWQSHLEVPLSALFSSQTSQGDVEPSSLILAPLTGYWSNGDISLLVSAFQRKVRTAMTLAVTAARGSEADTFIPFRDADYLLRTMVHLVAVESNCERLKLSTIYLPQPYSAGDGPNPSTAIRDGIAAK